MNTKKKFLGFILASLLGFSAVSVQAATVLPQKEVQMKVLSSSKQYLGIGYINDNNVRLRSGPGTSYTALGQLHKGVSIQIYSSSSPSWFYVKVLSGPNIDKEGYVHCDYVSAS